MPCCSPAPPLSQESQLPEVENTKDESTDDPLGYTYFPFSNYQGV